jgi:hypothetical protein
MLRVLYQEKAEALPVLFRAFFDRFDSLQQLVKLAFDRALPSGAASLVVFGLGRRIAADFDDVLLLCSERRAENALALIRPMFERLVTARYICNHPDETTLFAEYDLVQRRKMARRIKEVLGLSAEDEEKMQALEKDASRVEDRYRIDDCKKCKTTRINHTWHQLDVVAMVSKTEKPATELTPEQQEQAVQTRKRLMKMTVFGYYNPMGHMHATLKSISSAFKDEGGKLVITLPNDSDIATTMELAHLLLLESLLIQGEQFSLDNFAAAHEQATRDFNVVWHPDQLAVMSQHVVP